ncbi:MAG: DUF2092 domain-containing protein [Fimbriimonadales bacterium]|nr:DUF2092 domain-containing protein [Fimbriimonadales bacterium]
MRTLWIVAVACAATATGVAQQDAKAFLKQVQQKYRNAKSWEVQLDMTIEMSFGNNMQKQQVSSTVAMQRPNRVAAKIGASGFAPPREVYSDGKTVYVYFPGTKQYLKQPAPSDLKGANAALLGEAGLLTQIAERNLDELDPNTKIQFRGTQTIAGKQTRVVEITSNEPNSTTNLKLYVGAQDQLIYRLEMNRVDRRSGGQGNAQQPQQFNTKVVANLRYISFDKPISAARFRFTPPKDAKEMQPQPMPNPAPAPQQGRGDKR